MPRPTNPVPTLQRHKATNQAVVKVRLSTGATKDLYLGKFNSPVSKSEYARVLAVLAANGGVYPSADDNVTVSMAIASYSKWATGHYVNPDGSASAFVEQLKVSLGYVRKLFGPIPVSEFDPPKLKAVRQVMIDEGRVRTNINRYVGLIRQFFRWCVEEGIVPVSVLDTLRAVAPLTPGRSGAVESAPREPADPAAVEASLKFMSPAARDAVRMIRLTGARPSEILNMTAGEIDRSGTIWKFAPANHKTSWKAKARTIHIGPEAQAILSPWLTDAEPSAIVFSPIKSNAMRQEERRANRKTPLYPSHLRRNELKRVGSKRKRPPADRYDARALAVAVYRACKLAKCKPYSPYMLRHLRAVELREKYGLEVVKATLGHSTLAMSEHYARRADEVLASKAAAEIG